VENSGFELWPLHTVMLLPTELYSQGRVKHALFSIKLQNYLFIYYAFFLILVPIIFFVLDRSEDQSHINIWHNLHRLKAPRLKEHTSLSALFHTEAHLCTRITLHVSSSVRNHTPHNPEGELTSPSRYTSLFTTLSTNSFSTPLLI